MIDNIFSIPENPVLDLVFKAINEKAVISIADKNGIITNVNKHFCQLSKYTNEELIGKTHNIINSGYHDKAFWIDLWSTISSGKSWKGIIKNKAKDGTYYWVDSTIYPVLDSFGKITSYVSLRYDITDKKEKEFEAKRIEYNLQSMLDCISDGNILIDWEYNVLFLNKIMQLYFNRIYDKPLNIGDNILKYLKGNVKEEFIKLFNDAKMGKNISIEKEIYLPNNYKIWVNFQFTSIYSQLGNPIGVAINIVNIDEKKKNLELLKEKEFLNRLIIENAKTGILLINSDGFIISANPEACDLLNSSEVELKIKNRQELFDENEETISFCLNILKKQNHYQGFLKFKRNNQSAINCEVNSTLAITGDNQEITTVIFRDVTKEKELELKLKKANSLLNVRNVLNDTLIHITKEHEAMSETCRILIEDGNIDMSWIGLVDEKTQQVNPIANFGDNSNYTKKIKVFADERPEGMGPIGKAIRELRTIVVQNSLTDSSLNLWRPIIKQTKYLSSIVIPFHLITGKRFVLVAYSSLENYFNSEEIETLNIAINNLKTTIEKINLKSELQQKKLNLEALINNTEDIILSIDTNFNIIEFNTVLSNIIKYSQQKDLKKGDSIFTTLKPEVHDKFRAIYNKVLKGEKAHNIEYIELKEEPFFVSFETNYHPIISANEIIGISIYSKNVTSRIKQERTLNQLTNLLESTNSAAKIGSWDYTVATNKLFLTNQLYKILEEDKNIDIPAIDLIKIKTHIDDNKKRESIINQALIDGKNYTNEYRINTKSGIKYILSTGTPYKDKEGKIIGIKGTAQDITEKKKAELQVLNSQTELSAIVESSSDYHYFISPQKKVISFNKKGEQFIENYFNKKIVKGNDFIDYMPNNASSTKRFNESFNKAISGETVKYETSTLSNDKNGIWHEVSYVPVRDKKNTILGVAFNSNDITERKQIELELKNITNLLESTNSIAKIGNYDYNLQNNKTFCTKELYRIYGIEDKNENIDQVFIEKIHPKDVKYVLKKLDYAIIKGIEFNIEFRIILDSNNIKYILGIGIPYKNNDNEIIGIKGTVQDITERKLIELETEKIKNQLTSLSKNLPGAIFQFQINPDGTSFFPYSSQTVYELIGVPSGTFKNDASGIYNLIHPEDQNLIKETLSISQKNLTSYDIAFRILFESKIKWIKQHAIPIQLENGAVLWNGYMFDISNDIELHKEFDILSLVAQRTSNAVIITNTKQEIQWVNDGFTKITGYSYEEAIGKKPSSLLQFDKTDINTKNFIREQLTQKKPVQCEILNIGKYGQTYWLDIDIQPLYDSNDKHIGYSAIESDITKRKLLEESLRKNSKLLTDANRLAKIGSWEFDNISKTLSWDKNTKVIHEVSIDYIPNLDDAIYFFKDDGSREILTNAVDKLFNEGINYDIELPIITPKGTEKWVRVIGEALKGAHDYIKFFGIIQDIDERKRYNITLKEKEDAERSNKLKSDFLANMSHEIRTPMNAILGFTELLKGNTTNPKYEKYLDGILIGGNGLMTLINDILDLSKIESEKLELSLVKTNLKNILKELNQLFAPKITENRNRISTNIQKGLPENLLLDDIRVKQILFNVLGNAIKFTKNGDINISIKYSLKKDNKTLNSLIIEISDTGIGIPEENINNIFDPFNQVDKNITRNYGGTGLGLSISKRLISLMNGEISVESKIGKGSTFKIKLKDIKIDNSIQHETYKEINFNFDFNNAKILLVEDIFSNREIVKGYLEDSNVTIIEAENGEIATNILKSEVPDLILMDIMMPKKDGYTTAWEIKENEKLKNIPIIAITAISENDNISEKLNLFDEQIRKPFDRKILINTLAKYIKHSKENLNEVNTSIYVNDKQNLINNLKSEFNELIVMMSNDDVLKFANKLNKYALQYNEKELLNISNSLIESINDFDLESVHNITEKLNNIFN